MYYVREWKPSEQHWTNYKTPDRETARAWVLAIPDRRYIADKLTLEMLPDIRETAEPLPLKTYTISTREIHKQEYHVTALSRDNARAILTRFIHNPRNNPSIESGESRFLHHTNPREWSFADDSPE